MKEVQITHYSITGIAGTGKTHTALQMHKMSGRKRLVVVRSTVETRPIGFTPGTEAEKIAAYFAPYEPIMKKLKIGLQGLQREHTGKLRGTTWEDCTVVIDEAQNMTYHELKTIITRVGEDAQIIFVGDADQCDLKEGPKGYVEFLEVTKSILRPIICTKNYRSDLVSKFYAAEQIHKTGNDGGFTTERDYDGFDDYGDTNSIDSELPLMRDLPNGGKLASGGYREVFSQLDLFPEDLVDGNSGC